MKGKFMKKEKGITLIALVITIIVLLILAGVAISMLSGENGILTRASEAKTKNEEATLSEQVKIAVLGAMTNEDAKIDEKELKKELKKIEIEESDIISDGENGYIVKKGENSVNIKEDGNVENLEGITDIDIELENHFRKNNLKYKCRYGYITGVGVEGVNVTDTIADLKSSLPNGYYVVPKGEEGLTEAEVDTSKTLTTGTAIKNGNGVIARVVVLGDVDGNGIIEAGDSSNIMRYYEGDLLVEDYQIVAMDVADDGCIGNMDAQVIRECIAGGYGNTTKSLQNVYAKNKLIVKTTTEAMEAYIATLSPKNNLYSFNYNKSKGWNIQGEITEDTTGDDIIYGLGLTGIAYIKREDEENDETIEITTQNVQKNDEIWLKDNVIIYGHKIMGKIAYIKIVK